MMPAAMSEQRNAAALPTSSVVTLRLSGATCATCARILRKPPMPAAARVLIGPAEMALTRMLLRTQVGGQKAHVGLQARLGQAHDVVARQRARRAQVGQGQQCARAPGHERGGAARQRRKAIARNVVCNTERFARGAGGETAGQGFARREGHRVHQDVQ